MILCILSFHMYFDKWFLLNHARKSSYLLLNYTINTQKINLNFLEWGYFRLQNADQFYVMLFKKTSISDKQRLECICRPFPASIPMIESFLHLIKPFLRDNRFMAVFRHCPVLIQTLYIVIMYTLYFSENTASGI